MSASPLIDRRLTRVTKVSSGLAALTALALLGGTVPPAVGQPGPLGASLTKAAVKAGKTVRIRNSTFPVAGFNRAREANRLVVYRAPRKATPKTRHGVDVLVRRGKVRAVKVRNPARKPTSVKIPRGSYVLSGVGNAATRLRKVARVGVAVKRKAAASARPTKGRTSAPMGLPRTVQALYHMMWSNSGSPRLRNTPAGVNVVNLAFLQGSPPRLTGWASQSQASFVADARALRARGVRIVASVGGAGGSLNLGNRQAFVSGVMAVNAKLPLDGIDWDVEGGAAFRLADVVWISKRLRQLRGARFAITMAPNGSNIDHYRAIAVALHRGGALSMIGQQFYDAVVSKEAARGRVAQLVSAGIPQAKISIGMMVGSANTYWTVGECMTAVRFIKARYRGIRGGYLWEAGRAGTSTWATRMSPILKR